MMTVCSIVKNAGIPEKQNSEKKALISFTNMSEELGISFIQYFYQCFDGNMAALQGIYVG